MKIGQVFIYFDGQYSKVKINAIREFEELNLLNDEHEIKTLIDFEYLGSYKNGQVNSEMLEKFISNSRDLKRKPKCWQCLELLNEVEDDICPSCGWISCSKDRACGCNRQNI